MTFSITEGVLQTLGVTATAATYTPGTVAYDYACASLPFLSAAHRDKPYERALAQVRKQQIDQSDTPGEQSLDGWWVRSQTDWSAGAGRSYMEPSNDERIVRQFDDSRRVDVWTPGQFSLLPSTTSSTTFAAANVQTVRTSSTAMYAGAGTVIKYWNGSSWTTCTGFSGTLAYLAVAGSKVWATNTSGAIYSVSAGSTAFSSSWTTASGATRTWWVKQRGITAQGADLLVTSLAGGDIDALTPLYTHPDSAWTWTSAADAPGAILVAGYSNSGSAVYRFQLDTTGDLPTLSGGAITTAELPQGEYIRSMFTYLSAYIILVTNQGVRVGQVGSGGEILYGPWSYEGATTGDVRAYGRFVWVGVTDGDEDRHGLIRLDVSEQDDAGRCAWAWDQQIPSGTSYTDVGSLEVFSDRDVAIAVNGSGAAAVYLSSTDLEASGWVRSGRVRYGTIEDKYFSRFRLFPTLPMYGSVTLDITGDNGSTSTNVVSVGNITEPEGHYTLQQPGIPQQAVQLTLNLSRYSTDTTLGPTVEAWQLSALPAVDRQELIRASLLCFDYERDRHGVQHGYDGFALVRWSALREAVRDGGIVRWQELGSGEAFQVTVEELSFEEVAPPDDASGFGGIITITLRTL